MILNVHSDYGCEYIELEDLDFTPFDAKGGRGRMWQLFGEEMNEIIEEMKEVLVA